LQKFIKCVILFRKPKLQVKDKKAKNKPKKAKKSTKSKQKQGGAI